MAENNIITPAAQSGSSTTDRVEATIRQLQNHYTAQYGSEYAALVRVPHDDFDL